MQKIIIHNYEIIDEEIVYNSIAKEIKKDIENLEQINKILRS